MMSRKKERWIREMDASEWLVLAIIDKYDSGSGITLEEIDGHINNMLYVIQNTQANKLVNFHFKLGCLLPLWLEQYTNVFIGRHKTLRFGSLDYMTRQLEFKKTEIEELVKEMTGFNLKQLVC
mgnify:CR=1 FL=1